MATASTADRILNIAERLVQTQGFNAFSYAHISDELRIKKASLHYHFPTKAELGLKLIERYHRAFFESLDAIDNTESSAKEKLERYVTLYATVLQKNRMCLCGMLAAEFATLPKPMREAVRAFFAQNEAWVAKVLDEGRAAKTLRIDGPTQNTARMFVSSLEGAMMIARSFADPSRFDAAAAKMLADMTR